MHQRRAIGNKITLRKTVWVILISCVLHRKLVNQNWCLCTVYVQSCPLINACRSALQQVVSIIEDDAVPTVARKLQDWVTRVLIRRQRPVLALHRPRKSNQKVSNDCEHVTSSSGKPWFDLEIRLELPSCPFLRHNDVV